MTQHTPGPWKFTEGDASRCASSEVTKADDPSFMIALVNCEWANPHQRAEDIANARLIAAAPEMLDMLRRISETGLSSDVADLVKRIEGRT